MTGVDEGLVYFAHPIGRDLPGNIARARRWIVWLWEHNPDATIIAPWLVGVEEFARRYPDIVDDTGHPERDRQMRHAKNVAARCSGIVLCGGEISTGMHDELEALATRMITFERGDNGELLAPMQPWVSDLTELGREPPGTWSQLLGRPLAYGRIAWATRANR